MAIKGKIAMVSMFGQYAESFFRIALIISTMALFWACAGNEDETVVIPEGVLTEDKFTRLLTDYALAESAANLNIKNAVSNKIDSVYAFNPLIDNRVSSAQYDSTLSFYIRHPKLYKKVYENVLARLTELQAKRQATATVPVAK